MAVEYKVFRAPKGEDLTEITQVATVEYADQLPEPGQYDYAIQPVNTSTGETDERTNRATRDVKWAPDFVHGNVRAHLDAGRKDVENGVSTTGGKVTSWNDLANGNDATQTTDANRPDYGATALNGEDVISFESGESLSMPVSQSVPYTLGLVFQQAATGDTDILTGDISFGKDGSGSWIANGNSGGSSSTNWAVLSVEMTSGESVIKVNGTEVATGSGNVSLSSITIGGAQLDVAELVITSGVLPQIIEDGSRDPQRIEGYLGGRWNLNSNFPGAHPYDNGAPTWRVDPTELALVPSANGDSVAFSKDGLGHIRQRDPGSKYITLEISDSEHSPTTSSEDVLGTAISGGLLTFNS